ncbi:hypothetical protein D3C83_84100 [compost metagenome]
MLEAAYLVFDLEQPRAALRVDEILEAVLMLIAFFGHEAVRFEKPVRACEIGDVDRDVVAVVRRR